MIGDGMGLSQITAGMIANHNELNLERFRHIGLIKTFSSNDLITDSAAGATAFACGKKTHNAYVGLDAYKRPMTTILELAHERELSTGLIATSYIQHATPASFFAHQPNRYMYEEITEDILAGTVDIAIGGGRKFFDQREDGRNLIDSLAAHGYEVFNGLSKAKKQAESSRVVVLAKKEHLPQVTEGRGRFLAKAADFATGKLKQNNKGFFLMIEGSQIDFGGHSNNKDYIVNEVKDFDYTIGKVLDFAEADGNTLVIVTADHETGGFAIEGGDIDTGEVYGDFTSGKHTATMVPVFAYGPGAEEFTGIYENTEIFTKMINAFGFDLNEAP